MAAGPSFRYALAGPKNLAPLGALGLSG